MMWSLCTEKEDKERKMIYYKEQRLNNGRLVVLRNGERKDGEAVLDNFIATHAESDYLLTYPEECSFTVEMESNYLEKKKNDEREVEILATLDDKVVGTAGIDSVGRGIKVAHRCTFGVSILKEYWGMGIGRKLTMAAIEAAKSAGYTQIELDVVKENEKAINLYKTLGFVEYGENERGFKNKEGEYQSLILMKLVLS